MESPASIMFPSLHPDASCVRALTLFLLESHNNLIRRYLEDSAPEAERPRKVAPRDLNEDLVLMIVQSMTMWHVAEGRMRRSETILNIKSTCLIGSLFSFR